MEQQISFFRETVEKHLRPNFPTTNMLSEYLSSAIFLINIGTSDYIHNYLQPKNYNSSHQYNGKDFAELLTKKLGKNLEVKSVLGPCEDENDDIQDDDVSLGADSVQRECSESNSEVPGLVNVDFADVRAIKENAGSSLMGIGTATGLSICRIGRLKDTKKLSDLGLIKDGNAETLYPRSSFAINCTGKGDVCKEDVVLFTQKVYKKFGKRTIAGRVVKEIYGSAKQQHTFTFPVQRKNRHCNGLLGHVKRRKASSLHCGKLARHFLLTWFLVFGIISYDIS
ncbi:Zinc finger CCCH domain-containing protein 62 [Camellia lanceoleosa]|nr:Zinc finger CCCH domain-containing protein 62 [Camellia lanceoleosa]